MSIFAMFLAVIPVFGEGLTNSGYFYLPAPNVGAPCYAFGTSRVTGN